MLKAYKGTKPKISKNAYVIGESFIGGDVTVGDNSSIWPKVSARGDVDKIVVGKNSNIQDNSVLHCDHGNPCIIGDYVTIGHNAVIHGCTIGNEVLVGIGVTILSGAVIEDRVLVAAGSLVTENKTLKSGKLYMGVPAKPARDLTEEELAMFKKHAEHYVEIAQGY